MNAVLSDGLTAVMLAAKGGHLTCLKFLVSKGANVNATSDEGFTAVMFAVNGNHLSSLRLAIMGVAADDYHLSCLEYLVS